MEAEAGTDPQLQKSKKKSKKKKSNLKVTIEVQSEEPGKLAPLVGYFPSGYDPNSSANAEVRVFRHQKKAKRLELVVSPTGSKVNFVGTNYSGEAAAGRMCSYALGVLDKETQKLKIVPIAANKVFRLEPRVRKGDISDIEPMMPTAEATTEEKMQKLNNLTASYGTIKDIKRARKANLLRQKEDPTSQQGVDELVEDASIDKEALASTSAETTRNIPPHDLSATTPDTAYPLEQIIPSGEWDYLVDILEKLQSGEEMNPDVYPSFVCNRVYKLDVIKDEEEKRKIAGILSYITHLVNFKNQHMLGGNSSSKGHSHNIPSMIFQKFTKMFVDVSRKRLSDEKIGALISYVLVLTLHVDEFQTDWIDIAKDLKMTYASLRPFFENLGCKYKRRNNVNVATLPVPLVFPVVRKRRRRG